MMKKISLTRALAEVKLYEKKLEKQINGLDILVGDKLHSNPSLSPDKFISLSKASLESFKSMYDNRTKLKSAIAKANVETKVKVTLLGKDKSLSIVELIDLKASSKYLLNMYDNLERQYSIVKDKVNSQEYKIQEEVSKQVESAMSNKSQTSKDLTKTLTDTYTKMWGAKVVGLDMELMNKEKEELLILLDEIDMTLSEINAKTEIEIEL